jgi:hypothetical protein
MPSHRGVDAIDDVALVAVRRHPPEQPDRSPRRARTPGRSAFPFVSAWRLQMVIGDRVIVAAFDEGIVEALG